MVVVATLLTELEKFESPYEMVWPIAKHEPWSEHLNLYDALAVELAIRYDRGQYDFGQADDLANMLFGHFVMNAPGGNSTVTGPSLLLDIYDAFDAGEGGLYCKSGDPVSEFTNPAIKAILAEVHK